MRMLDPRLVIIMEELRTRLDRPIRINDWYWGGSFNYRGFRPNSHSSTTYSQHKFGRAVDFDVDQMTADEVRSYILDHENFFISLGLSRLESGRDARTWVHIDLAWTGQSQIYQFRDIG